MTTTQQATQNDHNMSTQVFTTYELLEAILHHLPTKDLLLNQRVCRSWRDVIARSQKLQRALFFLPVKGGVLLNNWRFHEDWADLWAYRDSATPMRVFQNPLLAHVPTIVHHFAGPIMKDLLHSTWRRPEASWRKMLMSQPATVITLNSNCAGCRSKLNPEGPVRAGELLLMAERQQEVLSRRCQIWVDGIENWCTLECNEQLEELPIEDKA